ncbi:MAG: hypothetical protein IH991_07630 [Planctomycetes bacterium]|nr:hypothetical protein [Planctomycetota bacterium]
MTTTPAAETVAKPNSKLVRHERRDCAAWSVFNEPKAIAIRRLEDLRECGRPRKRSFDATASRQSPTPSGAQRVIMPRLRAWIGFRLKPNGKYRLSLSHGH